MRADCQLGEHVAQLRCASGISEFRTFYVGALPQIDEKEPNSDFESPQEIALNHTVQGVITSEDVDYFAVDLKKGQRLSVEVEAMRLDATLFDPTVAILDERRFELVVQDDTPLLLQDCAASIVAPEDGRYIVQLRESSYRGNGASRYRMHVGNFPRPMAVFPAGGKRGEPTQVRFIGDVAGDFEATVAPPADAVANEYAAFATDAQGIAPSGNPFRPFEHGNSLEAEPNNNFDVASQAELPNAFNGVIEQAGDVDFYRFTAKKGQSFDVECFARRLRTPLDPVMHVYNGAKKNLAGNDDSRGPDSYFRFTAPADGDYYLRVTDHLSRGGPEFVYRVEFHPVKASLTVGIPRVARYSQYRQAIFVARGNRFASLFTVSRQNFGGEVVLDPPPMPDGVQMIHQPMPANMNIMPVVFEAAADAPIAGKLVDFRARHADETKGIAGGYTNRADFIISAPGQSLYQYRDVQLLPIAVVDKLPVTLEIVQPKAPLVRNGTMQLKIVAHREEGFDKAINVQFPFRPPGLGANSSVSIPAGKNEALYTVNANGNAAIGDWPVYAIGQTDVGGSAWIASQMAQLKIAQPYVTFEMQNVACEQGQQTQILCKLNQVEAFEGEATARIVGLPPKIDIPELKFTKATTELVFEVTTHADSPVGKHKSAFCQVQIPVAGETVVANAGGVQVQIDKPLPAPAKPAPKKEEPAKKAQPKKPAAKPLSRLEKLRQAAKERANGG